MKEYQARANLYDIEHEGWFEEFQTLEDDLTKTLLLVALMAHLGLIDSKESTQVKTYLMCCSDQKR